MSKTKKRQSLLKAAAEAVRARQELCENYLDEILSMAAVLTRTLKKGGVIYLAGNGGSAADCDHFATELVVRLTGKFDRPPLAAVSLAANASLLTAAGNDYGMEQAFARQVQALAGKKDVLIIISTSGNSPNLVEAARTALSKGVAVFALLGSGGGKVARHTRRAIIVPSSCVQRIQEEHIFIIHNLVHLIEQDLFG